jgi:S-layer protein (TIGR01567 family)
VNGRTVPPPSNPKVDVANNTAYQDGFQYTTLTQPKEFQFKSWGSYFVISFMGSQWFAGYDSSITGKKASKSLLEHEYLGRVLLDVEAQGTQGVLLAGNYTLSDGYEMRIRDVENDSIFLQLMKDGLAVDSSVVKSNTTYVYKKDLGDVTDMPILMVHVSNVFNNGKERFAAIDGVFQISDRYLLPVEPGLGMGKMEIVSLQPSAIVMVNNEYVNLNRDSTVSLGPGMNIRVADNDTLRYFIYTTQYVVPAPKPPMISSPRNVTSNRNANFSMIVPAAELRLVTADIIDAGNRTINSQNITGLASGAGALWNFSWIWNATTLHLSDDNSPVLDARDSPVPGLLYLNPSQPPVQVGVLLDLTGRISSIVGGNSIYYISPDAYKKLNTTMDYDAMLANETVRGSFIKIVPGVTILQFLDVINGRLEKSNFNHTLQGTLESLEPHAVRIAAPPGRYELAVRIENAVAAKIFGQKFNVTSDIMRGVTLGHASGFAGEKVSLPLAAPTTESEKRITIEYESSALRASEISGRCHPTWEAKPGAGKISVLLPSGCGEANLTFLVDQKTKANTSIHLNVTGTSGFIPETVANGTITVLPGGKKSSAPGLLAALVALAAAAYVRRWR